MTREREIEAARGVPVAEVATRLGLEPKAGTKYACVDCDSSDALSIKPDKERAKCFSCGESWDAIGLVQAVRGCTFSQAYRWINGEEVRFELAPDEPDDAQGIDVRRRIWEGLRHNKSVENPLGEAAACGLSAHARAYLAGRGLYPRDAAFEPGGLVSAHPSRWGKLPNAFKQDELAAAGLITQKGRLHMGWLRDELILMPYFDANGDLETFRVRATNPQPDAPKVWSLCGSSPSHPFGWPVQVRGAETLYICEGELDAMSLWDCGRNAIGVPGVNGWNADWRNIIDASSVIVLIDNDKPGREMGNAIKAAIPRAEVFSLDANDPNEALQAGTLEKELSDIEAALWPNDSRKRLNETSSSAA